MDETCENTDKTSRFSSLSATPSVYKRDMEEIPTPVRSTTSLVGLGNDPVDTSSPVLPSPTRSETRTISPVSEIPLASRQPSSSVSVLVPKPRLKW